MSLNKTDNNGAKTSYPPDNGSGDKLADNVLHFGRVLRSAGIPIGSGRVLDAIKAIERVGLTDKTVFYWTLHSVFVHKSEHRELFDQAFHLFWKNPRLLEKMMQVALPRLNTGKSETVDNKISRRVQEAFKGDDSLENNNLDSRNEKEIELDAVMTYSETELLQTMDFEQMSSEEINRAKQIISKMDFSIAKVPSRRFKTSSLKNKIDLRKTLQGANRFCGDYIPLKYKSRRYQHPPVIAICDISGSMTRYSRMLLHFMHVLTSLRSEVHTFLFGTRLTNVTRFLRYKDVDDALGAASSAVEDWSGGTRIGDCLKEFNFKWSRRVLGHGAIVLFISDGLDRGGGIGLSKQMNQIQKSSKRLIWLNPLLRFDEFAPKPTGVKAILPYVDEFRPIHSLDSMDQLVSAISQTDLQSRFNMSPWLQKLREIGHITAH